MDRWSIINESQLVWTVDLMIKPKIEAYINLYVQIAFI